MSAALEAIAPHFFTTRHWPLGQRASSDADSPAAWAHVAAALGLPPANLSRARQVHGAAIVRARADDAGALPTGDILIADGTGGCGVQTADCVPLLLADPRSGTVAAVHAGWRGLVQHVPQVAVEALVSAGGIRTTDLVAAIGPAIGPCCYEVGDDVREAFVDHGWSAENVGRWFHPHTSATVRNPSLPHMPPVARPGRAYLDTWRATQDQLLAAGLLPEHVHTSEMCTASHAGVFCSYRRDRAEAGRMAAAIRGRS